MPFPKLTFYSELESEDLQEIFSDQVVADLSTLRASLALGILDLSQERAALVKRLNRAGIPVIAWLLLPMSQGYWFNLSNAAQAAQRYAEFRDWSAENDLQWEGVGLDIEPDVNDLALFFTNRWKLLKRVARRIFDYRQLHRARQAYQDLVRRIQADGLRVDSYQFPFIADERKARSTLLQRAAGLVDIPADREVWMLYSSFARPYGAGFVASFAPEAQAVALGVTGRGMEVEVGFAAPAPLSWEELERDLRLAWNWCDDLHIFSLEGCLRQGFLERLKDMEWDYPLLIPESSLARVRAWRHTLRSSLWLSTHFLTILLGMAAGLLVARWVRWRRRAGVKTLRK